MPNGVCIYTYIHSEKNKFYTEYTLLSKTGRDRESGCLYKALKAKPETF